MKKLVLICAPVSSRSGYGAHSRDLVQSFIEHDKYDIKILDVRWGDCPRNALDVNNPKDKKIIDCYLTSPQMDRQPDIYIDIRIPNEFETYGKFNIGITAGVETTAVSNAWLDGCNKMDLIIVPSEHTKSGFVSSVWDKIQPGPNGQQQKVGEVRCEKPIEVLFEGADEDIYKPLNHTEIDTEFFDWLNDEVPEKFAFLHVGQWTKGGYGEDRKDISRMIKVFCETFANQKKQPALIMKTNGATYSIMDREEILHKIQKVKQRFPKDWNLPNIYVLHGDLTDEEMNYLYNHPKVKAMVSFTHGEGFGRPLLEATMAGLPVMASGWSGQVDFLSDENSFLIPGKLTQVPKSMLWKDIIIEQAQWFEVDELKASNILSHIFTNQDEAKSKAKKLMDINRSKFTLNNMSKDLDKIMSKFIESAPQQVGLNLNLPKLKRMDKPKEVNPVSEMKLPKLKKVNDGVTA